MAAAMEIQQEDNDANETVASLYNVMSTLYCLSIAADFRKPVEVLYPNIAASYLSVIKNPMDLGTLLLECMKGVATSHSIRQGLRLVFSNSLRFNAGSPMMEAISQHLESFASGLFEEATRLPFIEKNQYNHNFRYELVQKRGYRLNSVCKMPLSEIEIRSAEDSLLSVHENLPQELAAPLANVMETVLSYYSKVGTQEMSDDVAPILTLEQILRPLVEAARTQSPLYISESERKSVVLPSLVGLIGIPIQIRGSVCEDNVVVNNIPSSVHNPHRESPSLRNVADRSASDMSIAEGMMPPALTSLLESNMMPVDYLMSMDMIGSRPAYEDQQENVLHLSNLSNGSTVNEISPINSSSVSSNSNINNTNNNDYISTTSFPDVLLPILPSALPYLTALDDSLGMLLTRLEERLLRGTNHSSVWQRPLALMWAQPAKAPWWPAMVLASSESKIIPNASTGINTANISRIPSTICKQLIKLKAKFQSSETKSQSHQAGTPNLLTVPDGYALVEFFGTHDFGWVKQDTMIPMHIGGYLPGLGGKIGCGAEGVRNSVDTGRWLTRADTSYMSPWHRQRYLVLLKQQDRIQRKAAQFSKRNDKNGKSVVSTSPGTDVEADAALGTEVGVISEGVNAHEVRDRREGREEVEVDEHREEGSVIVTEEKAVEMDVGLDIGQGLEAGSLVDEGQGGRERQGEREREGEDRSFIQEGTLSLGNGKKEDEGRMTVEKEIEKEHDEKRSPGSEYGSDDDDDNGGWRGDGEDEEDVYDTPVPSVEDLEREVALPRLAGGYCSIGHIRDDDSDGGHPPPKFPTPSKNNRANIADPKKRRRSGQAVGKIKAPPKGTSASKSKGGTLNTKSTPAAVCAAPDALQRAEAGDYSGLLVNGLFMSSVLLVDAYLVAKDAAIEKTIYFTRWTEMVHPVPGGPTLPERRRGGRKKATLEELADEEAKATATAAAVLASGLSTSVLMGEGESPGSANGTAVRSGIGSGSAGVGSSASESKKRGDEQGNISATEGPPIKRRRRRKRAPGEPTIDSLCLHIKPGRKAGWAAIQAANAAAAAESLLDSGGDDFSEDEEDSEKVKKVIGAGVGQPIVITPLNTGAITGPFHILYGGCTRHVAGEGAIHTRSVDTKANVFNRESRSRETRKEILRSELLRISESLSKLQALAAERDREKAAERERLKAAVLSRGIPSGSQGRGSGSGNGTGQISLIGALTKALADKKAGLPALAAQQQRKINPKQHQILPQNHKNFKQMKATADRKNIALPIITAAAAAGSGINAGISSSSFSSQLNPSPHNIQSSAALTHPGSPSIDSSASTCSNVSVPPKVWMPTASLNIGLASNNLNSNGAADIETSSEVSEGEEDKDASQSTGMGGFGAGGGGGSIADQETEDEVEEKEESDDDDGVLAMARVEAMSDVETEDENFGDEDGDGEDEVEVEVDEGEGDDYNSDGGAEYSHTSNYEEHHQQIQRSDMGNEGEGEGLVGESFSSSEEEEEEEEEEGNYGSEQQTDVYQSY